MKAKWWLTATLAMVLCSGGLGAQNASVAARLGYPQTILHSGKIVTMDDASFEPRVGTIVQAMAVRDGRILATGSDAEMRALAGPRTSLIDLKGRTVLPGLISTHEHPTSWMFIEPRAFRHALPGDDVVIARWMPNKPFKEQLIVFEPMLREAVSKSKPGQWIMITFNYGPNYEWASQSRSLFRPSIKQEWLDQLAPNNPVVVKDGFINASVNQKAYDALHAVHPALLPAGPVPYVNPGEGPHGFDTDRWFEPDAMFRGKVPLLAQILKNELELWTSFGFTSIGSSPYSYNVHRALDYLDKRAELPNRFGWGYLGPDFNVEVLRYFAGMLNHGTDYLWYIGMWERFGSDCSTAAVRTDYAKAHETGSTELSSKGTRPCNFAPGSKGREILERMIETGNRIATMHTAGDKDIDNYMDAIEEASKRAGITPEELRAKRHAMDHSEMAPRPDQIPRIKDLGMVASLKNSILWEPGPVGYPSTVSQAYGIEYTSWMVPRKSLADAGVPSTWEMDKPKPDKVFLFMKKGMDRYNDFDKKFYGADQKTDRTIQLKAMTRWGAYYLLREDVLGTLEPGKMADFIVLDKDILAIPEEQIPSVRVLMTVVGGKTVHLVSTLASEMGIQAVGATTWKEAVPEGW